MSHEFLVDLTEEQQELVSGGGKLDTLNELNYTNFENQLVDFQKDITSSRNGSSVRKRLSTDFVFTEAYDDLKLGFEAPGRVTGIGGDDVTGDAEATADIV
ncbi:CTB family bacteriocin [Scytonema sp. UIC 10036]|uniref:CTB family bacteriocin n=1 Tax=Scytonema sp. UIC 10036 TaxID=2304196 RepID=UPI001A9AC4C0|nr:CTB family bacteriocin [Scytonema sp. UIC 10036]